MHFPFHMVLVDSVSKQLWGRGRRYIVVRSRSFQDISDFVDDLLARTFCGRITTLSTLQHKLSGQLEDMQLSQVCIESYKYH